MTERLYYDDAYLTEFDARVTEVRPDGWVALDRSAFYPTSGGQPYDTGVLEWDDQSVAVTDVEVKDNVVWHRVDGALTDRLPAEQEALVTDEKNVEYYWRKHFAYRSLQS